MTQHSLTSLEQALAWLSRLRCQAAEAAGEDVPANAAPQELYRLVPTPCVQNLQVQGSQPTAKHAWDTQRMVHPLGRKRDEKSPTLHISWWWGSHLQPLSLESPHLGKTAPSNSQFCTAWYLSGDEG